MPRIDNRTARAHFLDRHALAGTPAGTAKGADLQGLIDTLGFVQIDSINTVARAHHMILHARRPAYRPRALELLHDRDRGVFEHWTHDASMISMQHFPHWRLKFRRYEVALAERWKKWGRSGFEEKFDDVLRRISDHGPCCSADVGEDEARSSGGWWDWHPSKTALEYLWRTGQLSVTRREGFRKVYDLTENVIPDKHLDAMPHEAQTIDWACNSALDKLGFATSGEIAAFWDLITPSEAKVWCAEALARGEIIEIEIEQVDGRWRKSFCRPGLLDVEPEAAPSRMRILSPFDPALRDRKRAERLFGFFYRIEIFVPEPQRKYGYYVFPIMEGDRLVGRIDMKAERDADRLHVRALWPEPGVAFGKGRLAKLAGALERSARLANVSEVSFEPDWLR
ncbi:winged helix-turn-helix domain-containing protein [Tepidamorphus sp. 3E244]|uniref:winged helix-turn-helix domain-containing protein n=1 Tax=Tepidamorphus sp. 3E244 TaxID=3385498 RepID=UPI0038FC5F76